MRVIRLLSVAQRKKNSSSRSRRYENVFYAVCSYSCIGFLLPYFTFHTYINMSHDGNNCVTVASAHFVPLFLPHAFKKRQMLQLVLPESLPHDSF